MEYTVVGGMPEVVQKIVDAKQMNAVLTLQQGIICYYKVGGVDQIPTISLYLGFC